MLTSIVHGILIGLWDSAFAQFGIAGLFLASAVAVLIWVPSAALKHAAVIVAAIAIFFLIFAPRLYMEGLNHEKALWDAANAAAVKRGDDARSSAESEIPALAVPINPPAQNLPGPLDAPLSAPTKPAAKPAKKPSRIRAAVHRVLHPHSTAPAPSSVRGDPYARD